MVFQNSLLWYVLSSNCLICSPVAVGHKPSPWVFTACKNKHLLERCFFSLAIFCFWLHLHWSQENVQIAVDALQCLFRFPPYF